MHYKPHIKKYLITLTIHLIFPPPGFLLGTLEILRKQYVQDHQNIIKLNNETCKLQMQIASGIYSVLSNLIFSLLSVKTCKNDKVRRTRERQDMAIKHSFKGCITLGTREKKWQ